MIRRRSVPPLDGAALVCPNLLKGEKEEINQRIRTDTNDHRHERQQFASAGNIITGGRTANGPQMDAKDRPTALTPFSLIFNQQRGSAKPRNTNVDGAGEEMWVGRGHLLRALVTIDDLHGPNACTAIDGG
jgi:hypothetical protein